VGCRAAGGYRLNARSSSALTVRHEREHGFVLNIVQTVALIFAALASVYAVATSEFGRRLDVRRRRVERVFDATLVLSEAAERATRESGQGSAVEVARKRLRAEIQIVGVKGLESTELMIRDGVSFENIVSRARLRSSRLQSGSMS
jgi:hypothetical protein